jgi:hypothetical protein
VKYAWVARHKKQWPITVSCATLDVSASGYFEHWKRLDSSKPSEPNAHKRISDEALLVRIRAIHAEVKREYGWPTQNLLDSNFTPEVPNQVWTSDITYIATDEGWLYLTDVIDLFSRQVVGWCMSSRMQVSADPKLTQVFGHDKTESTVTIARNGWSLGRGIPTSLQKSSLRQGWCGQIGASLLVSRLLYCF